MQFLSYTITAVDHAQRIADEQYEATKMTSLQLYFTWPKGLITMFNFL